ncbi:MAG: MFS transporter [Thermoplasmata archaeon]|nr:MFS transporter [Thermoplasmata archaeon]MCI4359115.1 MFS transporter [Thermoplasmata archaeon]
MDFKWRVLGVVSIGSLMGSIDSTVLLIAFPDIARELGADLVTMVWVIMIYILMGTALVLSLGRLSDMKGRKRLYNAGFVVFVLGSLLSGFAQNGLELVAFRGVQGVGGAMLVANSFAILSDAFPPNERGRAFGINSVVWGTGSIVGFALGGLILAVTTWRWIFFINVPIGVVAIALAALLLRESVTPDPKETFDFAAASLFVAALALFLLGVTDGILYGWVSVVTWAPLLLSAPALAAFLYWEAAVSADPILPFSLFRDWLFSASLLAAVLQGIALFATNFLLMVYFQGIRGVTVITAAYLLIPLSVTLGLVGPIGGRLSDRYGARVVSTVGLLVQALALFGLATISGSTSLWTVGAWEAVLGVGGGLFFPANTASIMAGVPRPKYGVASGVMMTLRNSSMALSFAVALIAVTARLPSGTAAALFGGTFGPSLVAQLGLTPAGLDQVFLVGMRSAFAVSGAFLSVAAVFSVLRGKERRAGEAVVLHRPTVRSPVAWRSMDEEVRAGTGGRPTVPPAAP